METTKAKMLLNVNGQEREVATDPDRPLLDVLREDLHLTGTKYGCGESRCGACSVLLNGRRAFSCTTTVGEVLGKKITTIEGLLGADGDHLHPAQQAFLDEHAFQCGYCTAGMIVATVAMLNEKPKPSDTDIVEAMNGNLCRCCSYANILAAVKRAAANSSTASAAVRG
jgi:aerobic-type carbon monoxide dehydrogenase small subunit (CoxS/CutS family)